MRDPECWNGRSYYAKNVARDYPHYPGQNENVWRFVRDEIYRRRNRRDLYVVGFRPDTDGIHP